MSTHFYVAYPKTFESFRTLAGCLVGNSPRKLFTIIGTAGRNGGRPALLFGMDTMDPLRVIQTEYGFSEFNCRIVCHDNAPDLPQFAPIIKLEAESNGDYLKRVGETLFPVEQ